MAWRNRVLAAVLTAVVTVGLAACGDTGGDAGAPGSVAGEGPARPAAGGDDLVVDQQPLEAPVLLDPVPDGLLLTDLAYAPPDESYEPERATLYGDPDLADTLDGPVLLVGRSSGSATMAGPPYGTPGEREVDLGGRTGRLVADTDRTWVVIEGNDYREFVVGRGIAEDELIAAARGADFDPQTASLAPDAVPNGLEPLVVGSPEDGPYSSGAGQSMSLQGNGNFLTVSAVRADPRLAALWGFWVEDATGSEVRGHPGSAGNLQDANVGGPEARGRVWAEDGMVLAVVLAQLDEGNREGDPDRLLDEVVDNLRVGTWEEFEALDGEIRERPPTREEAPCLEGGDFVSGVTEGSRWAFALRAEPLAGTGEWSVCSYDVTAGSISGGSVLPPPSGELAVEGFGSGIVGGVAPPGTARVTVTAADGRTLEAVLIYTGPRPGERVWGAFIPEPEPPPTGPLPFTVTAYDAAGAVLVTKAQ